MTWPAVLMWPRCGVCGEVVEECPTCGEPVCDVCDGDRCPTCGACRGEDEPLPTDEAGEPT